MVDLAGRSAARGSLWTLAVLTAGSGLAVARRVYETRSSWAWPLVGVSRSIGSMTAANPLAAAVFPWIGTDGHGHTTLDLW